VGGKKNELEKRGRIEKDISLGKETSRHLTWRPLAPHRSSTAAELDDRGIDEKREGEGHSWVRFSRGGQLKRLGDTQRQKGREEKEDSIPHKVTTAAKVRTKQRNQHLRAGEKVRKICQKGEKNRIEGGGCEGEFSLKGVVSDRRSPQEAR